MSLIVRNLADNFIGLQNDIFCVFVFMFLYNDDVDIIGIMGFTCGRNGFESTSRFRI